MIYKVPTSIKNQGVVVWSSFVWETI